MKAGILASVSILLAASAQADEGERARVIPCFRYADVTRQLQGAYAETPISLGIQSNGNLLQVFASADTGSWTIVSTTPDGMACVLAAGNNWESVAPARRDPSA
jgi:hypothetical protein